MTEPRIDYSLGEYQSAVNGALEKMRRDNVIERIRAKDYTLWKSKPDEIVNRLGWLEAPSETLHKFSDICAVIEPLKIISATWCCSASADRRWPRMFSAIFSEANRAIPACMSSIRRILVLFPTFRKK